MFQDGIIKNKSNKKVTKNQQLKKLEPNLI